MPKSHIDPYQSLIELISDGAAELFQEFFLWYQSLIELISDGVCMYLTGMDKRYQSLIELISDPNNQYQESHGGIVSISYRVNF